VEQTIKPLEHLTTGEGLEIRLVCKESNNRIEILNLVRKTGDILLEYVVNIKNNYSKIQFI
jgi:hypothetical protein